MVMGDITILFRMMPSMEHREVQKLARQDVEQDVLKLSNMEHRQYMNLEDR